MPDDVVISSLDDAIRIFEATHIFVVSKDDKDIGCFMLTADAFSFSHSAFSFVHPHSCKLGLITITVLSLLVCLHKTINSVSDFVFFTTQKVIANKWIEVWPFIEVKHNDPLLYIGRSYDLIMNNEYLLQMMATKYPEYQISVVP